MKKINNKSAEDNAGEMMLVKMNELPKLAHKFLKFISEKIGFCGETCFTAYIYYSVFVLKMKCNDESHIDCDWMNEWWEKEITSILTEV